MNTDGITWEQHMDETKLARRDAYLLAADAVRARIVKAGKDNTLPPEAVAHELHLIADAMAGAGTAMSESLGLPPSRIAFLADDGRAEGA